jgi:hypothetical protein
LLAKNLVPFLFGVVLVAFGLYRVIKACNYRLKIIASRNWPEATGTVAHASIDKIHLRFFDDWDKRTYHYWTRFVYSYTAAGSRYYGEFKIDPFWGTEASANENYDKHSKGSTLPVHYNPENPEECITQYTETTVLDWFVTLLCLLIGLLCLFATFYNPNA